MTDKTPLDDLETIGYFCMDCSGIFRWNGESWGKEKCEAKKHKIIRLISETDVKNLLATEYVTLRKYKDTHTNMEEWIHSHQKLEKELNELKDNLPTDEEMALHCKKLCVPELCKISKPKEYCIIKKLERSKEGPG